MNAEYPIIEFDPDRSAVIRPEQVVKKADVPEHCVLCFFQDVINKIRQKHTVSRCKNLKSEIGVHPVYILNREGRSLALLHPGVGAPLTAALFEEVVALGCRKFVVCGSAGVLDRGIAMGHLLVPTAAIRDEGTSYHYLPPGREVKASPEAVAAIEKTIRKHKLDYLLTKTWTTDAIYRETPQRIADRKSEGCLAVEMEAAALFAVAQFRGVSLGQLLYGGDDVSGSQWNSRRWTKNSEIREKLFWLSAEACLRM